MAKRAPLSELKVFANKVRAAGGGNPIDALMPAVPQDASQCLIAKNLNFNCVVGGLGLTEAERDNDQSWSMTVEDGDVAQRIADAIGSTVRETYEVDEWDAYNHEFEGPAGYCIPLPPEIGQIAADFDLAESVARRGATDDQDIQLLREMVPYFEESVQEAVGLATAINDKGELIL